MQRFIYILFFLAVIAGCNDNSATSTDSRKARKVKSSNDQASLESESDTLGLSDFLLLKASRFRQSDRVYENNSTTENEIAVDTSGWAAYKRMNAKNAHNGKRAPIPEEKIRIESNKPNDSRITTPIKKEPAVRKDVSKVENKSPDQSEVTQVPASSQTKEKKDAKKSVSKRTKGAIIGAATGAAAGAVINKRNRKAGGVVGGIIGAAAGYGLGRHKDKKDTSAKREKDTTDNKQQW